MNTTNKFIERVDSIKERYASLYTELNTLIEEATGENPVNFPKNGTLINLLRDIYDSKEELESSLCYIRDELEENPELYEDYQFSIARNTWYKVSDTLYVNLGEDNSLVYVTNDTYYKRVVRYEKVLDKKLVQLIDEEEIDDYLDIKDPIKRDLAILDYVCVPYNNPQDFKRYTKPEKAIEKVQEYGVVI